MHCQKTRNLSCLQAAQAPWEGCQSISRCLGERGTLLCIKDEMKHVRITLHAISATKLVRYSSNNIHIRIDVPKATKLPISVGTGPLNTLLLSRIVCNRCKDPISVGIGPVLKFRDKSRLVKSVSNPSSVGNVMLKKFSTPLKKVRDVSSPIPLGTDPNKELFSSCRSSAGTRRKKGGYGTLVHCRNKQKAASNGTK
jgi:hypothetical protein